MADELSELLKKALALPAGARAALAGSLLESLDETVDAGAEEEWQKEIARRIQDLDSGKVKPVPWAGGAAEDLGNPEWSVSCSKSILRRLPSWGLLLSGI